MRRIGYYTPHIVNWTSGAANARMPMLEELVERGHHIVLMRKKHQREKPESMPSLPPGSFTQLNLEKEQGRMWEEPPNWFRDLTSTMSKTDRWMSWNCQGRIMPFWPAIDVLFMEPFNVFPPNILFQMQMIKHYAPQTRIVMYDMDLGHGAGIMGRMRKLLPAYFADCLPAITTVSMHDNAHEVYGDLRNKHVFLPFGAWYDEQLMWPNERPEVDLVFVGRDLFRRPRMKELVLKPSELGVSVRVHGKYPTNFKMEWPNVEWRDEVPPSLLQLTMNEALATIVILQSRQRSIGFYPIRFVDGAISGALQLVDKRIQRVERYVPNSMFLVDNADDVVRTITTLRNSKIEQRRALFEIQLAVFQPYRVKKYVDVIEAVLEGDTK